MRCVVLLSLKLGGRRVVVAKSGLLTAAFSLVRIIAFCMGCSEAIYVLGFLTAAGRRKALPVQNSTAH